MLRNHVDEADCLPMCYRPDVCFVQMHVKIVQNRNHSLFEMSQPSTGDSVDCSLFTHLMITLSGVLVETLSGELVPNLVWSIIADVTTDLTKEDVENGDEELLSSTFTMDCMPSDLQLPLGESWNRKSRYNIVPDADAQDEADTTASDDKVEVEVATSDGPKQVKIGKKRKKLKVTKVPMSQFTDTDIMYAKGHTELTKQDWLRVQRTENNVNLENVKPCMTPAYLPTLKVQWIVGDGRCQKQRSLLWTQSQGSYGNRMNRG